MSNKREIFTVHFCPTRRFGARAGVFGYAAHLLNREGVFSHTADPDVTIQALVAKTPPMLTDSVDQVNEWL